MMMKVFDFVRSCLWYIVDCIYDLITYIIKIIKQINAFDIINSLSNNDVFRTFYKSICVIAVTLLALVITWQLIKKVLEPDSEITVKAIMLDSVKCGFMVLLSTFLFTTVAKFSINLAGFTGNMFENSSKMTLSSTMLTMFIDYKIDYYNSDKFKEDRTIADLVGSNDFDDKELYIEKYVTKKRILFSNKKDYKYDINWIMAMICGGFMVYSLFFSAIMLGRRQIEFLFLFTISPIIFATSVCNKQRRGAVIEQLVSLTLQSAVVMLIVGLTTLAMGQISETTFFQSKILDMVTKIIMYLGCGTFILTGSQVINRFIGANVSASSGREQLMSLMGFGKLATAGAVAGTGATVGGALLGTGGLMKAGRFAKNETFSRVGTALGQYGAVSDGSKQSRFQKMASTLGNKMYVNSEKSRNRIARGKSTVGNTIFNAGADSINSAIRTVIPRSRYNTSYYRKRKNMM